MFVLFLLFNVPSPTVFYTLSLHDALPISVGRSASAAGLSSGVLPGSLRAGGSGPAPGTGRRTGQGRLDLPGSIRIDRKSTRLNSSHRTISYAVFCLKKKKNTQNIWIHDVI